MASIEDKFEKLLTKFIYNIDFNKNQYYNYYAK